MTAEDENFLSRWVRLKGQADSKKRPGPPLEGNKDDAGKIDGAVAAFDVTSLPSIDSITAASDVRAFLQSGVPAELTKAALRQLWAVDPVIRDFIGIAENQWDFTDPAGIPGFGPLEATDELPKLIAQAMGDRSGSLQVCEPMQKSGISSHEAEEQSRPEFASDARAGPGELDENPATAQILEPEQGVRKIEVAALQQSREALALPRSRAHGGALPK